MSPDHGTWWPSPILPECPKQKDSEDALGLVSEGTVKVNPMEEQHMMINIWSMINVLNNGIAAVKNDII